MDTTTAVRLAQDAIRVNGRRLVDAVLARGDAGPTLADTPVDRLPLIGVTASTGWECHAIVAQLARTRRFRVRAMYRTTGTQAEARLLALHQQVESEAPGLLTLESGVDLNDEAVLTRAFRDCDGIVLYLTANTARAGRITNHGKDPVGGRAAVMRQVTAALGALRANPSVAHVVTLIFPTDKVTGIAADAPPPPWWVQQRLLLSDFLRAQGIDVTCIHRPAYYYAMHRVDDSRETQIRGDSELSRTMIKEGAIPGILPPDVVVNWVDVRDVGKWVGTVLSHPDVFRGEDFSIASSVHTGDELVEIANANNRHGARFAYRQFPVPVMKMLSLFREEVVYPLRYAQWYGKGGNGYDFASNADLEHLDRVHPRITFEDKLEGWGINELQPAGRRR